MKKLSVLFAAVMMVVSVGMAKAQKIATLDVTAILNAMPEKKKADTEITNFVTGKQGEIKKKADAAQAKYELYSKEGATKTEAENKVRMEELQKLQQEIAQMEEKMRKDATAKQDALFEPIEKKLMDAVNKVAKANSYEYIMDVNASGLVYKGGPDATAAVKKELGL